MGIFDKAKDLLNEHNDKVDQGIDKAAELIDQKTGGQHTEQIEPVAHRGVAPLSANTKVPPRSNVTSRELITIRSFTIRLISLTRIARPPRALPHLFPGSDGSPVRNAGCDW